MNKTATKKQPSVNKIIAFQTFCFASLVWKIFKI